MNKLSAQEEEQRLNLWKSGYNDAEIAEKTFCSVQGAYAWRASRGLARNCMPGHNRMQRIRAQRGGESA